MLLDKCVVCLIQLRASCFYIHLTRTLKLHIQQPAGSVADGENFCGDSSLLFGSLALHKLTIVYFVYLAALCNEGAFLALRFRYGSVPVDLLHGGVLWILHLTGNIFECAYYLLVQVALESLVGQSVLAVHGASHLRGSENHFGVIGKVLVDVSAAFPDKGIFYRTERLAFIRSESSPFAQHYYVGDYFCPGVALESSIRQADSPQKVGVVHQVFANPVVVCVHRIPRGYECHKSSRAHLVKRLRKEVVVDCRSNSSGVGFVRNGIIAERHVAYGDVHVIIGYFCLFKALYAYIAVRIEVFCNVTGDVVQLDHCPGLDRALHIGRHSAYEVTNAAGGFEHSAALEAQVLKPLVHGAYNIYARIMGIEGACPGGLVFFRREQGLQLVIFLCPALFFCIKHRGEAAPPNVLGEGFLFLCGCIPIFGYQVFDDFDSGYIGLVACFFSCGKVELFTYDKVGPLGLLCHGALYFCLCFLLETYFMFSSPLGNSHSLTISQAPSSATPCCIISVCSSSAFIPSFSKY